MHCPASILSYFSFSHMLGFAADRNFRVLLGIFLRVKPRSHHNTTQVSTRRRALSHICRVIKLMLRHVAATQRNAFGVNAA